MSKQEFVKEAMSSEINNDRVEDITKIYDTDLSDELKHFISYADTIDFFDDERRALSYDEIKNPQKQIGVDFTKMRLIPVVDAYDNTYIAYSVEKKKWVKYNTIDNMEFKERDSIQEII